MSRRRSLRYHQRRDSEDEFETPALQIAAERNNPTVGGVAASDESDDEVQSESGLGESPEEDLVEEAAQSSGDDENHNDEDRTADSDSDSAPEEVSFAKSQEAAEKRQELIKREISRGRQEERERRRKRDELFKLQKKEKLAALNKRKLPEELLEELSQESQKKQKTDQSKGSDEDKQIQSSEEEEEEDLGSDSEEEEDGVEAKSADFLPLTDFSQKQVEVVSLQGRQGHGSSVAQSVADFKQAMLYGGRHKRLTSQQLRNQTAKRVARR